MSDQIVKEKTLKQYSFQEVSQALFDVSSKLNLPIAIWKLPVQDKWELIIGKDASALDNSGIEDLPPGFLINKFRNKGLKNSLYIKSLLHLSSDSYDTFSIKNLLGADFALLLEEELNAKKEYSYKSLSVNSDNELGEFKKLVENAVYEISRGAFQKVILSRQKEIRFTKEVSLIHIFENLSKLYGNAFTSLISIPEFGVWMGASPETLICVKDNIFRTCALAGTQQMKESVRMKDVLWSQKEIEEQALVSRYIINSFKSIRLREFDEEGPKTVQAGNLLHLKTDFKVDMKEVDFPILGSQMLEILHPTSAVCGMPHKSAFDFILSQENFDRELYAGYLGPVNVHGSTDIFVNLRCMKIVGSKAMLFAGVGITEDSDPEKEWQETEMKFRTLLNVLSY